MKIVFFTSGLSGGGAERVCCNLANFLCQREHDIEFITMGFFIFSTVIYFIFSRI